jgi:hypothetical protein
MVASGNRKDALAEFMRYSSDLASVRDFELMWKRRLISGGRVQYPGGWSVTVGCEFERSGGAYGRD